LPYDLEIKLLLLTKNRERVSLKELAEQFHVHPDSLIDQIVTLHENALVDMSKDFIELDATKRMLLADHLIRNGHDPEKVSRSFKWQEFEEFTANQLIENGYRVFKHLVFKSKAGRREIDLLAWNDNFILSIDCKHWSRRLSASRVQTAASAQTERTKLLAERPDVLMKHGLKLTATRRILSVIVTLAESEQSIINGVPVVPIMKLPSFLYVVSPVDETLRMIPVKADFLQSTLD
jgi:Holliday junction resolvase-like predicted endonuclease